MSPPTSTPRKPSSAPRSHSVPPPVEKQLELINLLRMEIGDQKWQFDAGRVAHMLSPKKLKPESPWSHENSGYTADPLDLPSTDDFHYLIDDLDVQAAFKTRFSKHKFDYHSPSSIGERSHYDPLVYFLNECVAIGNQVYMDVFIDRKKTSHHSRFPIVDIKDRWWPHLTFHTYDRPTGDGIGNASPLKPDLVGVDSESAPILCFWKFPSDVGKADNLKAEIAIATEAKDNWPEMIWQSATYGRAEMATIPLRAFSLVIAFNSKSQMLRFLIFHHGGISATKELSVKDQLSCKDICLVMLSILLWQSPTDAGIPPFTNGINFLLPPLVDRDESKGGHGEITNVLHHALSVRGRSTWIASIKFNSSSSTISSVPQHSEHFARKRLHGKVDDFLPKESRSGPSDSPFPDQATSGRYSLRPRKEKRATSGSNQSQPKSGHGSKSIQDKESSDNNRLYCFHNKDIKFTLPRWKLTSGNIQDWSEVKDGGVLKGSWPQAAKRNLEARMFSACTGNFGSPDHIMSFEACYEDGSPVSNSIFLPSANDNLENVFWNLHGAKSPLVYPKPDFRSLCFSLTRDEGETLENCTSAFELMECLLHSMLGWLDLYQHGFLHRDISIGNILKLKSAATSLQKDFSALPVGNLILPSSTTDIGSLNSFPKLLAAVKNDKYRRSIADIACKIHEHAKVLTSGAGCKAIWTDGDMGADMAGYFESAHDGTVSGTPQFMSMGLLDAEFDNEIQSPADDIESFLWVGLWSSLRNTKFPHRAKKEIRWSRRIADGYAFRETTAINIQQSLGTIIKGVPEPYSNMFRTMAPILSEWYDAIRQLRKDWILDWSETNHDDSKDVNLLFHSFAYRGVLDFIEIFQKHKEDLEKTVL
ncbi:hypothetical protein C8J55DRAFT_559832 [Lentinula edodes]|uniref:Fungal-type protein kinase domain-containing protein n=1 Tax=Lentinula lateritia TaxID=40482 RepID=A0A9W9AHM3_9AGAR|nr:hypothetical protein C8J55DRAFT_559832 [Lentinula edodes]